MYRGMRFFLLGIFLPAEHILEVYQTCRRGLHTGKGDADLRDADSLLYLFPASLRGIWQQVAGQYNRLEEIRLRADRPVLVKLHGGEFFMDGRGCLTHTETASYRMTKEELAATLNQICHDSLYAYEDELKQGFLTVPGGHRVGIAGQVVLEEDGRIRTMKHIASMNIRIAHEIRGAADSVLPYLYEQDRLCNTLIISPPGCGKTTLLRDLIRQVSDGNAWSRGRTVGVVDERSEIAGSYLGKPQNDLGIRTDVLDACPKVFGMLMLIRSMAPELVAVDEVGSDADVQAIRRVSACGCGILATVHGSSAEELLNQEPVAQLLKERLFTRYIEMEKGESCPGVRAVYAAQRGSMPKQLLYGSPADGRYATPGEGRSL